MRELEKSNSFYILIKIIPYLCPKNKNSNYWTQDDNQIKIIDKNKNLKIWGGKWAKEDLYKSGRKFRNKKQYVFHGGIWNETTKEKNEDPKN